MSFLHSLPLYLSVLFWAVNAICLKTILVSVSPYVVIFLQYAILVPFLFIVKKPQIEWKWLLGISCGWYLFNHFFLALCFESGMSVGFGIFLHKTCVLFSWFFSYILFRESPQKHQYIGIVIALIGLCQLIAIHFEESVSVYGIFYILLSAAFWGFGAACQTKNVKGGALEVVIWASALSAFPMFFIAVAGMGWHNFTQDIINLSWQNILYISYTVVFGLVLAGYFWLYTVKKEGMLKVSPFILLSPPLTYLLSVLFLNERVSLKIVIAFSIIILGLMLTQFGNRLFVLKKQS